MNSINVDLVSSEEDSLDWAIAEESLLINRPLMHQINNNPLISNKGHLTQTDLTTFKRDYSNWIQRDALNDEIKSISDPVSLDSAWAFSSGLKRKTHSHIWDNDSRAWNGWVTKINHNQRKSAQCSINRMSSTDILKIMTRHN